LQPNAAPLSSPFFLAYNVAEDTSSWSSLDLALEDSEIDSSLDAASGSTIGEVDFGVVSDFAHVGGTSKSSDEPTVCIESGGDLGCGDAGPGDSAAASANDDEDASTLEGFVVGDVNEATAAPTGCVIGEVEAGHAIEAV